MGSGETVNLYDANDQFVDVMVLPTHYMAGEETRWVMVHGKKYVEGGKPENFYGKGQFVEVSNAGAA